MFVRFLQFFNTEYVCVCVCVTSVGLSLLARSGRLRAILRLDLDQVGSFLLAVEGGSSYNGAAARVDAEELRVAALVLQDNVVDLRGRRTTASVEEDSRVHRRSAQVELVLTMP